MMNDAPQPFTPEQEARVREIVAVAVSDALQTAVGAIRRTAIERTMRPMSIDAMIVGRPGTFHLPEGLRE